MVMLVLPASSASSTHTSRKNDFVGAVVFANHQEAQVVESGGSAEHGGATLPHDDALAGGVGGAPRKKVEDGRRAALLEQGHVAVDGGQKLDEETLARVLAAGFDSQRGRFAGQLG